MLKLLYRELFELTVPCTTYERNTAISDDSSEEHPTSHFRLRLPGLPDQKCKSRQPKASHFYHHSQNVLRLPTPELRSVRSPPSCHIHLPPLCLNPHPTSDFEKKRGGPQMNMCYF